MIANDTLWIKFSGFALAKLHKAELITGDKEFEEVKHDVKILWM
jgi:hypothetical protein